MKKILETELFFPIKELLIKNEYVVCSEIEHCDIVAKKGDELIIVELKTTLSMELILQAIKRQRLTEYVYIGIPHIKVMKTKKWKDYLLLLKRLGLGLIVVGVDFSTCEIVLEPDVFDIMKSMKQFKRKKYKLLNEFNGRSFDQNIGGSNKQKIMTSYKEKTLYIACCLRLYGPLSPKKLRELGADSYKTTSILSKNFNQWFYKVKSGIYDLSDEGKNAINHYQEITEVQMNMIIEKSKEVLIKK